MKIALLAVIALLSASCDMEKELSDARSEIRAEAQQVVDNMYFIRHANGQCFGVVRYYVGGSYGYTITDVPPILCK